MHFLLSFILNFPRIEWIVEFLQYISEVLTSIFRKVLIENHFLSKYFPNKAVNHGLMYEKIGMEHLIVRRILVRQIYHTKFSLFIQMNSNARSTIFGHIFLPLCSAAQSGKVQDGLDPHPFKKLFLDSKLQFNHN